MSMLELIDDLEEQAFREWVAQLKVVLPPKELAWARVAWKARAQKVNPCRGITDSKCVYLAHCGGICNKCGKQHDNRINKGIHDETGT